MAFPSVALRNFRTLAAATVASYALLVLTGGAVRLTGSGLGCPDWPSCYQHHLTAQFSFHPEVEFANRLATVAVSVLSIAVFVAALRLRPARRDLVACASGILAGLVAQIVLGGLVVHFKLNPYLVALHFVLTLAVLAVALVMHHRASVSPGPSVPVVGREIALLSRLVLAVLTGLICLGTMVTGSGPHAGATNAKRIAVAFRDIAEVHSTVALFLIGLVLALLFALRATHAPDDVERHARIFFEILVLQGILGYTQYLLHDNAAVVELHLAGATAAWCAAIVYVLRLRRPSAAEIAPSDEVVAATLSVAP